MRMKPALMRKILIGLLLFGSGLLLLFVFTNDKMRREKTILQPLYINSSYHKESLDDDIFESFDLHIEQTHLSSGKNIFFLETSSFGHEANHFLDFNCRQACAVESAARANPGMLVNLLFVNPTAASNRTRKLIDLLGYYNNVRVCRVLLENYIKESPLAQWLYDDGKFKSSHWPIQHMSDILRYLTLWRFGGIYLDLDVVIIKSLEDLSDFGGAEDSKIVAAGVIGFSASNLGRRIANDCLHDQMRNYRGDLWGNSPAVITRTLQKFCAVNLAKDMTKDRCNGFEVFPPSTFYPIFYTEWQRYFTEEKANETMQLIEQARAIHVWNKFSSSEVVRVGSRVPYALVAEKHCPRAYYGCGTTF